MYDRRSFLIRSGAAAGLALAPRMAFAKAETDRRFVFIIQRGAADGLHTVAPIGDPAYAGARGQFAADFDSAKKLDSMFALHPAMTSLAGMYDAKEALFAHAIASPYRDRSHFDGQNVLESGGLGAYQVKDGWLNRMLGVIPSGEARAIAVSATVPLALRGPHEVASYALSALPQASDDLMMRVASLYSGDGQLHGLWSEAMNTRTLTSDMTAANAQNAAATGALAAKLLAPANGARIAMIETGGWDTHAGQRARLANQLKGLDAMIAALKTGMGAQWSNTMVLVATEFGRTVAVNGTGGSDHGTGSAAMLIGGGVRGGRVMADWPGLGQAALYEGRDLKPTLGLDQFVAGAVAGHYGVEPGKVMATLFPDTKGSAPVGGLV
ncbi:MAG: DUF1501 domain-containing protein [Sphingomonas sp.]|uniref:DUF1501 domain-containing protein n=1 Tax=Sphingomonas sp. TaxID=28214 RepID=UPI0011FF81FC|nr:DUF1501 domain-containing protein [Sphingomonas sp.]THD37717.1 MAG: DUF1501 domain-containing protein [Sphingomonas sp.]